MSTDTYLYQSDGRLVSMPADPSFFPAGKRISARDLTLNICQLGLWYAQKPLFQGLQTTSVNGTASTWSMMVLQSEMVDNYDMHTSLSSSQVIPPQSANYGQNISDVWLCFGYIPMNNTDTTSVVIAGINDTDTGIIYEGTKVPFVNGHNTTAFVVDLVTTKGNPFAGTPPRLELGVYQNTAAAVATSVSGKCPSLTVQWAASTSVWTSISIPATPHTWIPQDEVTHGGGGPPYPAGPISPGSAVTMEIEAANPTAWLYSPPHAKVTSEGSSQTIASSATFTSIQFPTVTYNLWNMWNTSANTRLTIQQAGLYLVAGYVSVAESATKAGYRAVRLLVNGTTPYGGTTVAAGTGTKTTGTALYAMDLIQLSVGDYVEVQMAQTNGSALTVNTGSGNASKLIALWQCN